MQSRTAVSKRRDDTSHGSHYSMAHAGISRGSRVIRHDGQRTAPRWIKDTDVIGFDLRAAAGRVPIDQPAGRPVRSLLAPVARARSQWSGGSHDASNSVSPRSSFRSVADRASGVVVTQISPGLSIDIELGLDTIPPRHGIKHTPNAYRQTARARQQEMGCGVVTHGDGAFAQRRHAHT
jgi:hypothetical protein